MEERPFDDAVELEDALDSLSVVGEKLTENCGLCSQFYISRWAPALSRTSLISRATRSPATCTRTAAITSDGGGDAEGLTRRGSTDKGDLGCGRFVVIE